MTSAPLVTVVIPTFNRAGTIGKAIDSVRAQSFTDWELIVVDDASSDDLTGALSNYRNDPRIRLERHQVNLGVSAARNSGIDAGRGAFVAFLDADDEWLPEKLQRQIDAIRRSADPDRTFCVTQTRIVMGDEEWERVRPVHGVAPGQSFAEFLYSAGGFAQASSFLLSRQAAAAIRFDTELRQYEDHLFFLSAGARGMAYLLVPEPLSIWHNDARPDRLSGAENERRAQQFIQASEDVLSDRERLAFEVRTLFSIYWHRDRAFALRLLSRAVAKSAMGGRTALEVLIRGTAPPRAYEWLRRRAG